MKNVLITTALVLIFVTSSIALNCQRTVKSISAQEVKIEITITKDRLTGFARLAEYIPEGSSVKYAKSEGGTFAIQENKLKFIWMAMPSQNVITVSYVLGTQAIREGNHAITGKFSYVEGDETKEFDIPASNFNINTNQVASIDPASGIEPVENNLATKVAAESSSTDKTSVKAAKVTYGLQLLSTKDKLPADYFSKKYQVNDKVKVEIANGLNKYVLGEFKTIAEAVTYRESLATKGCKDAFVVAFYNNQRIPIDEAKKLESVK